MAVRLTVDPDDSLEQIIDKLKRQPSKDIILNLPGDIRALQELNNFYTLRSAVRAENINLGFAGGNKTIRGLAKLLGFNIEKEDGSGNDEGGSFDFMSSSNGTPSSAVFNSDSTLPLNSNSVTSAGRNGNPAGNNGNGVTPFGMPDGAFVLQPQAAPQATAPMAPPARPQGMPQPQAAPQGMPQNGAPANRTAQDFYNEVRDFSATMSSATLQPPPAPVPMRPGDQYVTRENAPDFFDAVQTPDPPLKAPPPPPNAQFDLVSGSTMTFEEATRQGLLQGTNLADNYNPTLDEPAQQNFQSEDNFDDDVPIPGELGDNAAAPFRRGGVRTAIDDEPRVPKPKKTRLPQPRIRRKPAVMMSAGGAVAGGVVTGTLLTRVRRLLVPVEPRVVGGGFAMPKPEQSIEEMKKRDDERRRTGLLTTLAAVGLLLLSLFAIFWFVLGGNNGGGLLPQPPIALTVPLRTEDRTRTAQVILTSNSSTVNVPGVTQANPTVATTAAPSGGDAGSIPGGTAAATGGINPPVQPARLNVEFVRTGEIKKTGEADATGSRNVPDKPASGPVTFLNSSVTARSYGAGTVIWTGKGVSYRLVQGITVPAGNVFANVRGTASGTLVADKAGPVGNQQGPSLYLTDSLAIVVGLMGGGTERPEKFVTQGDLDGMQNALIQQASAEANNAVKYDPATQAVFTIKAVSPACTFSKKVNETVEANGKFNGNCLTSLEAAIYNKADAAKAVTSQIVDDASYKLADGSTIEFLSDPKLIDINGQQAIEWQVKGKVIGTVDEKKFIEVVAGKPKTEVPTLVATSFPQVNTSLMKLDNITDPTLPLANRLSIKFVPETDPVLIEPRSGSTPVSGTPNGTSSNPVVPIITSAPLTPSATSPEAGAPGTTAPAPTR